MLSERPLILASNRGPVEHYVRYDGRLEARRGSGGVVTALSSLTRMLDFTWVATAMGEGDRRVAAESRGAKIRSKLPGQRAQVRYVSTPRRIYHKYYNVFCNPLLWFLQHYMWNSPTVPTWTPTSTTHGTTGTSLSTKTWPAWSLTRAGRVKNLPS